MRKEKKEETKEWMELRSYGKNNPKTSTLLTVKNVNADHDLDKVIQWDLATLVGKTSSNGINDFTA